MAPVELSEDDLDLARWMRPGDGVMWSQACAEPVGLVDRLIAQAEEIGGVSAFCGLTWRESLAQPAAASIDLVSYGTLGRLAAVAARRRVRIVPSHFSALPGLFAARALPGDVALIQVSPPDEEGRCSFGVGADYTADAVCHARVVVAEVNARMPRVRGASIEYRSLDAAVWTDRPLLGAPEVSGSEADGAIARSIVGLIDDGDTIQVGVGALPEAILRGLRGASDLGLHSGMICDPVVELIESGALTGARKPRDRGLAVTGAALGSRRLFDFLQDAPSVLLAPVSYTHRADVLAEVGRLVAINGAVEVDLSGQVNAERAAGRSVGAVGGQVDFLRAALASGGMGIVALPASTRSGEPRIVSSLSGPVTTARSDVDVVVTEHGVARLGGLDLEKRALAMIGIASPEHRAPLARDACKRGVLNAAAARLAAP